MVTFTFSDGTLTRKDDTTTLDSPNLPCDFYRYTLADGTWMKLSGDVRAEEGPGCIYDHQMVIDEEEDCLWVFWGSSAQWDKWGVRLFRSLPSRPSNIPMDFNSIRSLATLWIQQLRRLRYLLWWSLLGSVIQCSLIPWNGAFCFSRSAVQGPTLRFLQVFHWSTLYHPTVEEYATLRGPEAGFTQRAAIDDPGRRGNVRLFQFDQDWIICSCRVPPPELETGGSNLVDETCAFLVFQFTKW